MHKCIYYHLYVICGTVAREVHWLEDEGQQVGPHMQGTVCMLHSSVALMCCLVALNVSMAHAQLRTQVYLVA